MLNDRVTIQKLSTTADSVGQPKSTWTELDPIWADVKFQSGVETMRADAASSTKRCSIRIRQRSDITVSDRVAYKGESYGITAVLPDSADRRFMFLVCESVK